VLAWEAKDKAAKGKDEKKAVDRKNARCIGTATLCDALHVSGHVCLHIRYSSTYNSTRCD
jgi:hypothetical protein